MLIDAVQRTETTPARPKSGHPAAAILGTDVVAEGVEAGAVDRVRVEEGQAPEFHLRGKAEIAEFDHPAFHPDRKRHRKPAGIQRQCLVDRGTVVAGDRPGLTRPRQRIVVGPVLLQIGISVAPLPEDRGLGDAAAGHDHMAHLLDHEDHIEMRRRNRRDVVDAAAERAVGQHLGQPEAVRPPADQAPGTGIARRIDAREIEPGTGQKRTRPARIRRLRRQIGLACSYIGHGDSSGMSARIQPTIFGGGCPSYHKPPDIARRHGRPREKARLDGRCRPATQRR